MPVALDLFSNFQWVRSSGYSSERLGCVAAASGPFLASRTGIVTGCGPEYIALGFSGFFSQCKRVRKTKSNVQRHMAKKKGEPRPLFKSRFFVLFF